MEKSSRNVSPVAFAAVSKSISDAVVFMKSLVAAFVSYAIVRKSELIPAPFCSVVRLLCDDVFVGTKYEE